MDSLLSPPQTDSINPFVLLPHELFQTLLNFLELNIVFCTLPFICKKFQKFCFAVGCFSSYNAGEWCANEPICKFLIESRKIKNHLFFWRSIENFKDVMPIQSNISVRAFATTSLETDLSHLCSLIATPLSDPTICSSSHQESLKSILSKVSSSLQALLLREFTIDTSLIGLVSTLNLKILHFEYCHFETGKEMDFRKLASLEKFVIKLEKNFIGTIILPSGIEELLLYCPKSSQMGNKVTRIDLTASTNLRYM